MTIPFERLKARLLANPKVKAEYDGGTWIFVATGYKPTYFY